DRMAGREVKGKALTHDRRHQHHLHQGEALSDADAPAAAKGQVCRAWTVFVRRAEPAGIEDLRVGPPAWVVVNVVDRDENGGAAADVMAADDVVFDGPPREDPHRREVTLRFLQACGGPRQPGKVVGGGTAGAQRV